MPVANFNISKDPVSTPVQVKVAAYTMSCNDLVVHCNDEVFTVTLPDVSEAAGKFYCIAKLAGTDAVTVADNGGDAAFSDITLNAAGERTMLYSDGHYWYELAAHYS